MYYLLITIIEPRIIFVHIQKISDTQWHMPSQSGNHFPGYTITKLTTSCSDTNCTVKCTLCGDLCYHLYKCDDMCFDYMNGNLCKHVHRIHSMPVDSVVEMELDVPDVDLVSTDNTEETNDISHDPVKSYSLPCTTGRSTCKK